VNRIRVRRFQQSGVFSHSFIANESQFHLYDPMNLKYCLSISLLSLASSLHLLAGDTDSATSAPSVSTAIPADMRYGPFGLFDHQSGYGQGIFPEPFLVDDSDLETGEFRIDWLHTKAGDEHADLFTEEIEKGFGLVTLEIEVPEERDFVAGTKVSGFDNINLGARAPFYQYVSPGGFVDTTFGTAVEAGVPTNSQVSKNAELVPKLFNDLALGSSFTLQSIVGYSMLYGPGSLGGLNTLEYGFVFGYTIPHKLLPIPDVQQLIPVFELQGYKELDNGDASFNELLGNAAVRFNLDSTGPIQPRLGIGVVFPLDNAAREEVHRGVYTSLVFEY